MAEVMALLVRGRAALKLWERVILGDSHVRVVTRVFPQTSCLANNECRVDDECQESTFCPANIKCRANASHAQKGAEQPATFCRANVKCRASVKC
jgi:hypothetical protein